MTDKPTPTDAELEALLLDKLPASKHYIRPVIENMVAAMQAAIDKWGQPAQAQADSVLKDHQIAALVNELRDIAIQYHVAQQLRERIAQVVVPAVRAAQADSVQEDAARYRWLAASCRSTSEHWGGRWSIIIDGPAPKSHDSEDDFDAAVDAARKQGEKQ